MSDSASQHKKQSDEDAPMVTVNSEHSREEVDEAGMDNAAAPLASKKALWGWLILCFSVSYYIPSNHIGFWLTRDINS